MRAVTDEEIERIREGIKKAEKSMREYLKVEK